MSWTESRVGKKGTTYRYCVEGKPPRYMDNVHSQLQADMLQNKWDEESFYSEHGIINPNKTWAEYRVEYEQGYRVNAENTIVKLNYVLNSFEKIVRPGRLMAITVPQCEAWQATRMADVEGVTVVGELKYLRPFFRQAHALGYIRQNPLELMRRLKKIPKKKAKRATYNEVQKFLEKLEPKYYTLGVLLYDTGMRREEVSAQRIEDVDFSRGVLHIRNHLDPCICVKCGKKRKKKRKTLRPGLCNTKTLCERSIPLTPRLNALLLTHFQTQKTGCLFPINEMTITEVCKRAWEKAGVTGKVAAHTFRHIFTDDLRRAGVDDHIGKALVGHGETEVHEDYMHVDEGEIFAAMQKLWEWRESQRPTVKRRTINGMEVIENVQ